MRKIYVSCRQKLEPNTDRFCRVAEIVKNRVEAELTPALAAAIAANPGLGPALGGLGTTPQQVAAILVGLGANDLKALPVAVVQTDQEAVPGEILGGYRNFGDGNK